MNQAYLKNVSTLTIISLIVLAGISLAAPFGYEGEGEEGMNGMNGMNGGMNGMNGGSMNGMNGGSMNGMNGGVGGSDSVMSMAGNSANMENENNSLEGDDID